MPNQTLQSAAPEPCLICGSTTCDRWHPEVPAWHEGWKAVEAVLAQMEADKAAASEPETKQAA